MADDLFPPRSRHHALPEDFERLCFGRDVRGQDILTVEPEGIRLLAETAWPISTICCAPPPEAACDDLEDPEATENDRFVAYDLLKNANIAAGGILPMCQDTGTAIVMAKKGRRVWTEGGDYEAMAKGILDAYQKKNLRYSQLAPLKMFEEKNTRNNLPAQIDIYEEGTDEYKFLFMPRAAARPTRPISIRQPFPSHA